MATVFDVLGADHAEVKELLAALEGGPTMATGATEQQLSVRHAAVTTLVMEAAAHEAVEEQHFWPVVRRRAPHGAGLSRHGTGQEAEAKHVLARLEKLWPTDSEFEDKLAAFTTATREHIAYEEDTVWPRLRPLLSDEEAQALGDKVTQAKNMAPTRPHPRTPASPAVLKTAGAAVAALDKLRDAVTGRGRA